MQHKSFPMSFDDFRLMSLSFSLNAGFKKKEPTPIKTQISLAHKFDKKSRVLLIRLKVSLIKGEVPFFFEVESVGRFRFKELPDDNTIETFSMINCPAIMFPYVRETIADITRRAGFRPLHLAPINFVALAEKRKGEIEQKSKK
ncbi:MAG: protein-export chaperone SecB [Thermodesulfobacteriota bacterium]